MFASWVTVTVWRQGAAAICSQVHTREMFKRATLQVALQLTRVRMLQPNSAGYMK